MALDVSPASPAPRSWSPPEQLHRDEIDGSVFERLELLREQPLFSAIADDQLLVLAQASETVHLEPGEYVVRQDEPGDSMYVIATGRVEVLTRIVRDGIATESVVASLREGDTLGELSMLDRQPRSASCVAVVPTTCVRLGRDCLRQAMMQHWTLSEALLETLASRLRLADKSMAEHARDPLTGVYNRRALYDLYDREARRTQRAARRAARLSHDQIAEARDGHELGRSERDAASGATNLARGRRDSGQAVADEVLPLAVLFVDVDKFKTINDTYGHATGDDVLCAVAHTLSECGRATDHVARFGGDEFVMLLPEAGAVGAQLVSDRIRRRLSDTPPGPVPFSISIGAAVVEPMEPPTLDALMARADEEMYRDKARQR